MENEIRYSLSNDTWGLEEVAAVQEVLASKRFTMGPRVAQFEEEFAAHFGAKYAVMSNSGSSANLLAVAALVYAGRLAKGDEVLVPAVSWSTTYFPLEQMGLKTRLVDIDAETMTIDSSKVEAAITPATKALFAVNLLGNPCQYGALAALCEQHSLVLLEDNCESMGAALAGKQTGTFGVIGTFSTFYSHHICTMEGGVSVTDDEELYHYMLSIRTHGWTRQLPEHSPLYTKMDDPFYESFNFIMPGFNLRPLEMEAAIGTQQLKKVRGFVETRRENAQYFIQKLMDIPRFYTQTETGESSWFGFPLVLRKDYAGTRDKYTSALRAAGIEVRPIVAGNFARQKAFRFMESSVAGTLDNADYLHDNGFFVGNYSIPMRVEIDLLFDTLRAV